MVKRRKRRNKKRAGKFAQKSVIKYIDELATSMGYKVQTRKFDKKKKEDDGVRFYPDVVCNPVGNKPRIFFEVENSINNHTISKSMISLLQCLAGNKKSISNLVVPEKKVEFCQKRITLIKKIIQSYSRKVRGAYPQIRLKVISSRQVLMNMKAINAWDANRRGPRPRFDYLPKGFNN
jgi:hypothetical protein